MKRICIIGAGASGLSCLSYLVDNSKDVDIDIYEKNNKVGRKILASGNGRCNITNIHVEDQNHYNCSLAKEIVLSNKEYEDYFNNLGLMLGEPDYDGRRYPLSNYSGSVVDVFNSYLYRPNVHLYFNIDVDSIKKHDDGKRFIVNNKIYDYVIVAIGSYADTHDHHISLYSPILDLGHHFTKMYPSIGPIKIKENLKVIEGVRIDGDVTLDLKTNKFTKKGEILFKKDELSGICVSELSTIIARLKLNEVDVSNAILSVDLLPNIKEHDLVNMIEERMKKMKKDYLLGIFQSKLAAYLVNRASSNEAIKIAHLIKNLTFRYDDKTQLFQENYHVVVGGVDYNEINNNCESKIHNNLYFGGEILNIDGDCGGYNLHFAFSSGVRIAQDILKKI